MSVTGSQYPKVSVIIPIYNGAEWLSELFQTIESQTFRDFEVILVDDGSTDNSWKEIRKIFLAKKYRIYRKKNEGCPSAARNFAIERSHGEMLAVLDCDDLWHPQKLELQVAALETHSDASFAATASLGFNDHRLAFSAASGTLGSYKKYKNPSKLKLRNHCAHSSCLIRKAAWLRFGGYSTKPELRIGEDYLLLLQLSMNSPYVFFRRPLTGIRIHQKSVTAGDKKGLILGLEAVAREVGLHTAVGRSVLAQSLISRAMESLRAGDALQAFRLLISSLICSFQWSRLLLALAFPLLVLYFKYKKSRP